MKRIMPGFAIETWALCATMSLALAQSSASSPSAPSASDPAASASQPAPTDQARPADQPAQAGGMQDTSLTKSKSKDCNKASAQSSPTGSATQSSTDCQKPPK